MKTIQLSKGYDLRLVGKPSLELKETAHPTHLALSPSRIPFVKPRLTVAKGERVAVGSTLLEDKRNSDIRFLAPGGGVVTDILFGPRRAVQEIVIKLDPQEEAVRFQRYREEDIAKMSREDLVQAIMAGGLWPLIKALPFRDYAKPDVVPPALFIGLKNLEPFHPEPQVYLSGSEDLFRFGVSIFNKLAQDRVYIHLHEAHMPSDSPITGMINLTYTGSYPAHDAGVLVYRMKSSAGENHAWYVNGQDVLTIARLLRDGRYPTECIVSAGGPGTDRPGHYRTRIGAPLSAITADNAGDGRWRCIQGGVLTGYHAALNTHLEFANTALNLLSEGDHKGELLGLFRPGYRKPTFSRAFLSVLHHDNLEMDCNMHGGERACIACGYCARVCPVDILPQFTYKAILAGAVEESLEHGLLDCVECALCAYVCPSKIDLLESIKGAKAAFYKEQAHP
jgi:Na+-transporting NADH:ubiquinone oxidoreductase subunit A